MLAEALRVDRRTRDDQLQVWPAREDAVQAAEQEVDIERAFVRFVDDHCVIATQQRVSADLREQQPVRDDPNQRVLGTTIVESDRVPDGTAERHPELIRDPLGDGPRRNPSGLGVGDGPAHPAPELQTELRQLGRLTRARLPGDHDDLVISDRGQQVLAPPGHRQLRRVGNLRDRCAPPLHARPGCGELLVESRSRLGVAPSEPLSLAA